MNIVECKDLKKYFPILRGRLKEKAGILKAVDGVSFEIIKGETLGLVGESGCGKTTLGKIILGILKPDSGELKLSTRKLQVIFQDPYNSLDPKMKVRDIIAEGLIVKVSKCQSVKVSKKKNRRSFGPCWIAEIYSRKIST